MPQCSKRTATQGAWAENKANQYLRQKGLQLVQKNYRVPCGEIDLIMREDATLVFVEVRYRSNTLWIDPLATIQPAKQRKLLRAADLYLQSHPCFITARCRFDVVAVRGPDKQPVIEWVRDAFTA